MRNCSAENVKDVFFDYDKYSIRSDELPRSKLTKHFSVHHPNVKVLVEGHCDDRGSEEYNIALGASRSESVKQSLCERAFPRSHSYRQLRQGKTILSRGKRTVLQQNRVGHLRSTTNQRAAKAAQIRAAFQSREDILLRKRSLRHD